MTDNYVTNNRRMNGMSIFELAGKRLDKLMKEKFIKGELSSCSDLFPMLAKNGKVQRLQALKRPEWLRVYTQELDKVAHQSDVSQVKCVVSVPPQHGKTFTTLCGLIYVLLCKPGARCMYVTFNMTRADDVRDEFVFLLQTLGYKCRSSTKNSSVYFNEGVVRFVSHNSNVTGYSCDTLLVADDLYSGFWEAQSENTRNEVQVKFTTDIMSRSVGGCAIIITNTRAHPLDISGHILNSSRGFLDIRIPALCDDIYGDLAERHVIDTPLCEQCKDLNFLLHERLNDPIQFSAMYQGSPNASLVNWFKCDSVYPHVYSILPLDGDYTYSRGIDLGYSGKGDKCAYVELARNKKTGLTYITKCIHRLTTFDNFADELKNSLLAPGEHVSFHGTAPENAALNVLRQLGIVVNYKVASKNKVERAFNAYKAWNSGKLLVHETQLRDNHERDLFKQVTTFTGNDRHDDIVDSLSSAFDSLSTPKSTPFIMSEDTRNALRRHHDTLGGFSV